MDVSWVNLILEFNKEKTYDARSDQSIERIVISSETIKITYNQTSDKEERYIRVIHIDNLLGYEYPIIRGEGI
jgi:hypothetical protein